MSIVPLLVSREDTPQLNLVSFGAGAATSTWSETHLLLGRTIKLCRLAKTIWLGEVASTQLEDELRKELNEKIINKINELILLTKDCRKCEIDLKWQILKEQQRLLTDPGPQVVPVPVSSAHLSTIRKYARSLTADVSSSGEKSTKNTQDSSRQRALNHFYDAVGVQEKLRMLGEQIRIRDSSRKSLHESLPVTYREKVSEIIAASTAAQIAVSTASRCKWIDSELFNSCITEYRSGRTPEEYLRAIDKMIAFNRGLVLTLIAPWIAKFPFLERYELEQIATLDLWRAAEDFDIDKGNEFSTLATKYIKHGLAREVPALLKASMSFRSLETPIGSSARTDTQLKELIGSSSEPDPYQNAALLDARNIVDGIKDYLLQLSTIEQSVIKKRFGFQDTRTHTLSEIGEEFDLTKERIRQIQNDAMKKLQEILPPALLSALEELIDLQDSPLNARDKRKAYGKIEVRTRVNSGSMAYRKNFEQPQKKVTALVNVQTDRSTPKRTSSLPKGESTSSTSSINIDQVIVRTEFVMHSFPERVKNFLEILFSFHNSHSDDQLLHQSAENAFGFSKATFFRRKQEAKEYLMNHLSTDEIAVFFCEKGFRADTQRGLRSLSTSEKSQFLSAIEHEVLPGLSEFHADILSRRLGLMTEVRTLDEVASLYGCSREAIRHELKKITNAVALTNANLATKLYYVLFPRQQAKLTNTSV